MNKVTVSPEGCWIWSGAVTSHGYGVLWLDGRSRVAHRVSYELHVGLIPDGYEVDHLCRATRCVRPEHLEAVTNEVNTARSTNPRGDIIRTGMCQRGHSFQDPYIAPKTGKRNCRECRRLAAQRSESRRRTDVAA
jgi:hypothetical protein